MDEIQDVHKCTIHLSTDENITLYLDEDTYEDLFTAKLTNTENFAAEDIDGDKFFLDLTKITFIGTSTGRLVKSELSENGCSINQTFETDKTNIMTEGDLQFQKMLDKAMKDLKKELD